MTRTEYCLDNLACVAADLAKAAIVYKYDSNENRKITGATIDIAALMEILHKDDVFVGVADAAGFQKLLVDRIRSYQAGYEDLETVERKGKDLRTETVPAHRPAQVPRRPAKAVPRDRQAEGAAGVRE